MKSKLIALLLVLIFSSCNHEQRGFKQELSQENLEKIESEVLNISVMIPKECAVNESKNKISFNLNPKGRTIKQFSISKLPSVVHNNNYKYTFSFENEATLSYHTFIKGAGSGGTEYELEGVLKIKNKSFLVHSIDQEEFTKGNPNFCLKYLSTIEILKKTIKTQHQTENLLDTLLNTKQYLILGYKKGKVKVIKEEEVKNFPAYKTIIGYRDDIIIGNQLTYNDVKVYRKYNPTKTFKDYQIDIYDGKLADPDFFNISRIKKIYNQN